MNKVKIKLKLIKKNPYKLQIQIIRFFVTIFIKTITNERKCASHQLL